MDHTKGILPEFDSAESKQLPCAISVLSIKMGSGPCIDGVFKDVTGVIIGMFGNPRIIVVNRVGVITLPALVNENLSLTNEHGCPIDVMYAANSVAVYCAVGIVYIWLSIIKVSYGEKIFGKSFMQENFNS